MTKLVDNTGEVWDVSWTTKDDPISMSEVISHGNVTCRFEGPRKALERLVAVLGIEGRFWRSSQFFVAGPRVWEIRDGERSRERVIGFSITPDSSDMSSRIEFRNCNPDMQMMDPDTFCMITLTGACDTPERVRVLTEELGFTFLPEGQWD